MSRIIHTLNMYNQVKHLPGDVIECGVAAGTTTFPLLDVMREYSTKKTLYACDTYKGLPYDDQVKNGQSDPVLQEMKKGECNYGNEFKAIARVRHGTQQLVLVEGMVEETMPRQLADKTFCFAWLDMDCYAPTSFAYKFLEDRMVLGGIIGFHDYRFIRCPGIQKVVEEEVDQKKYASHFLEHNCLYLKRIR